MQHFVVLEKLSLAYTYSTVVFFLDINDMVFLVFLNYVTRSNLIYK
jgi:hypothetical protein